MNPSEKAVLAGGCFWGMQDLLRIADRCPVHRTLENHPVITTTLIRD